MKLINIKTLNPEEQEEIKELRRENCINLLEELESTVGTFRKSYNAYYPDGRNPVYRHIEALEKKIEIIKTYLKN